MLTERHPFIGVFSGTTWVSWHQKGYTDLLMGLLWHQLDHMHIICPCSRTDKHASSSPLNFFTGQVLFLTPSQQPYMLLSVK